MSSSGWGRLLLDPAKVHDDLRLLHMAIRQRWEISEDFKAVAVSRLKSILETGDDDIAMKAIAEARHMESQNQKDEHKQLDEFAQRVLSIAARLGIDLAALGVSQATEAGASGSDARSASKSED